MTLGNMRELGVRSLAVTCELCHHEAVLQADDWGDTVLASARLPSARGLHQVRDCRGRREAGLARDAGERELAKGDDLNRPLIFERYGSVFSHENLTG